MLKKYLSFLLLATLTTSIGCSPDETETVVPETPKTYTLSGYYESQLGEMVIKFDGDQAKVITLDADNDYATNPSVFKVGDAYIKNIVNLGNKKWDCEIVRGEFEYLNSQKTLTGINYEKTTLSQIDEDGETIFVDGPMDYSAGGYFKKTEEPTGGGGGGTECIHGVWYSPACGDPQGVKWTFNSNGKGSFSNKDCNGICGPMVFKFSYTISGNTCNIHYDAQQPVVSCTGYPDTAPNSPNDEPFTFTCSGTTLTVTSGNGTNTFTK